MHCGWTHVIVLITEVLTRIFLALTLHFNPIISSPSKLLFEGSLFLMLLVLIENLELVLVQLEDLRTKPLGQTVLIVLVRPTPTLRNDSAHWTWTLPSPNFFVLQLGAALTTLKQRNKKTVARRPSRLPVAVDDILLLEIFMVFIAFVVDDFCFYEKIEFLFSSFYFWLVNFALPGMIETAQALAITCCNK